MATKKTRMHFQTTATDPCVPGRSAHENSGGVERHSSHLINDAERLAHIRKIIDHRSRSLKKMEQRIKTNTAFISQGRNFSSNSNTIQHKISYIQQSKNRINEMSKIKLSVLDIKTEDILLSQ